MPEQNASQRRCLAGEQLHAQLPTTRFCRACSQQLAVCLPVLQVHKARIITRAVRSMWVNDATFLGKLRVRLSTLQPWVRRAAALLQDKLICLQAA